MCFDGIELLLRLNELTSFFLTAVEIPTMVRQSGASELELADWLKKLREGTRKALGSINRRSQQRNQWNGRISNGSETMVPIPSWLWVHYNDCVPEYPVSRDQCCLRGSGVACFAIYRLLCHLNLWKRIDKQGVRSEHLDNRLFTIGLNGRTIDTSRFTPRHCFAAVGSLPKRAYRILWLSSRFHTLFTIEGFLLSVKTEKIKEFARKRVYCKIGFCFKNRL